MPRPMDHFRLTGDLQYLSFGERADLGNRFPVEHAGFHQGPDETQIGGSPHEQEEP